MRFGFWWLCSHLYWDHISNKLNSHFFTWYSAGGMDLFKMKKSDCWCFLFFDAFWVSFPFPFFDAHNKCTQLNCLQLDQPTSNDQWSLKSEDIFFLEYYLQKSSKHNLQLLQGPEVCYGKVWTCTFNASHSNLGFAYLTYLLIRQDLARVLELLCTDWTRKPSTLANLTYYFSWPVQFSAGVNTHDDM